MRSAQLGYSVLWRCGLDLAVLDVAHPMAGAAPAVADHHVVAVIEALPAEVGRRAVVADREWPLKSWLGSILKLEKDYVNFHATK